jgi:hypothetical protein
MGDMRSGSSAPISETDPGLIRLHIAQRVAARALVVIVSLLTLLSVAGHILRFVILDGRPRWFLVIFDAEWEHSFSTYYQGLSLLACAGVLAMVALAAPRRRDRGAFAPSARWWVLLAMIFVWLSFDELCGIHEIVSGVGERFIAPRGFLRYTWVVPGMILTAILGLVFLRLLIQLPRPTSAAFVVAGVIYVSGAIGMEMVGGAYADRYSANNLVYHLIVDVEELCEMIGVAIFFVAVLGYLSAGVREIRIGLDAGPEQTSRHASQPAVAKTPPVAA